MFKYLQLVVLTNYLTSLDYIFQRFEDLRLQMAIWQKRISLSAIIW